MEFPHRDVWKNQLERLFRMSPRYLLYVFFRKLKE